MANKFKGEVSFDAGDEKFILRFSANAVVSIEDAFDKTLKQMGDLMSDPATLRMSTVKKMFCIGLVDHYAESKPEIDTKMAETIFARLSPIEATDVLMRAFTGAFDHGKADQTDPNPLKPGNPTSGTGPASTATGVG